MKQKWAQPLPAQCRGLEESNTNMYGNYIWIQLLLSFIVAYQTLIFAHKGLFKKEEEKKGKLFIRTSG